MSQFFKLIRPYSWIKNFFIFVPLFFAKDFFDHGKLSSVILAFIVFCVSASCVYIFNDILDKEQDSKHSKKKHRPLASGAISVKAASILLGCLVIIDGCLLYFFIPQIAWIISLYMILNIAYSTHLKHIAILDILLVSSFYFLRVLVGGVAAGVVISHWLVLCIIFISLFLIVGKRLAEYNQENRRAVLEIYTPEFLNILLGISATLTIISYSLYGVLVVNSNLAILSIFFVLLGIMRYIFLVLTTQKTEYPEQAILTDGIILMSSILWICTIYSIFYLHL